MADGEKHTVTINGQEVEVSLDELRAGYMRQQDYTRKTQELAHNRTGGDGDQGTGPQDGPGAPTLRDQGDPWGQSAGDDGQGDGQPDATPRPPAAEAAPSVDLDTFFDDYADENDVLSVGDAKKALKALAGQQAQIDNRLKEMGREKSRQEAVEQERRKVNALARAVGMNVQAVEAELAKMPAEELAAMRKTMTRAEAYLVVHNKMQQNRGEGTPPPPPSTPPQRGRRAPAPGDTFNVRERLQDLDTNDRQAVKAFWDEYNAATRPKK